MTRKIWRYFHGRSRVEMARREVEACEGPDALLDPAVWSLFGYIAETISDLTRPRGLVPIDAAWCWYTKPGSTGWPLHRDSPQNQDHLTAWVALVDVGQRNGAIRWSPHDCDRPEQAVSSLEVAEASAGEVVVWDHGTWHCGGRVLEGEQPRICAAIEFGRADVAPGAIDLEVMARPDAGPQRGAALARYRSRYAHLLRASR